MPSGDLTPTLRDKWYPVPLLNRFGNAKFRIGSDDNGKAVKLRPRLGLLSRLRLGLGLGLEFGLASIIAARGTSGVTPANPCPSSHSDCKTDPYLAPKTDPYLALALILIVTVTPAVTLTVIVTQTL